MPNIFIFFFYISSLLTDLFLIYNLIKEQKIKPGFNALFSAGVK